MPAHTYRVIGLMSGSSLDGLDIAFMDLTEQDGQWRYAWIATDCMAFPETWTERLRQAPGLPAAAFLKTHVDFGHFLGKAVNHFLKEKGNGLRPDFIVSHGHTTIHAPQEGLSWQLGDGASIAAETGLPVISDLRQMDVALGGQGAPIVPIGDRLLFGDYELLLNVGGIANVTILQQGLAFDICPCNQILNHFAQQLGLPFDERGALAAGGMVNKEALHALSQEGYYAQMPPKSLANEFSVSRIIPAIAAACSNPEDALATGTAHIATMIAKALQPFLTEGGRQKMLVTGGGAFNDYLLESIQKQLPRLALTVPDTNLVQFKEALVMGLIGALRWRGESNVLCSVTGASRNSIGGAVWAGK